MSELIIMQPIVLTIDNSICLTETYYNMEPINILLKVDTKDPDYDTSIFLWPEEQQKLKYIKKKAKFDKKTKTFKNTIEYKVKEYAKINLGRMYPTCGNKHSYQDMYNVVRRLVIDGNLYSLDIVNAHPTILYQCCLKTGYNSKPLGNYNDNRKNVFKELMEYYNTSRDHIKNLFVRLSFGGDIKSWREAWNIHNEVDHQTAIDFYKEIVYIKTVVTDNFPNFNDVLNYYAIYEKNRKGTKIFDSAIAVYLQDIERQCMSVARSVCKEQGIEVQSLIHDEFLTKHEVNDETIKAIQTRIYQTLGFKLQFDAKKTAPTDEDKAWLESHKQFIPKDENDDDEGSYENIRNEYEKNAFKLVNHSEFATWKNDELIVQKKENFKIKYEELTFKEPSFDALTGKMVIKEVSFINKWFYDKDKRKYDTYDFIPPPLTCPDSVFNTWSGLQIEKTHSDVKPTDCQDLLDLIKVLSNNHDEAYEYILNWLAHIIQSPGKKCGTALVLKSKEGAGKNTLVDIMRMILGQFVAETANPQQDIFGTHGNIHIGKLLVCIDEVKSGDTSRCIGRLKNLITSNTCIHNPKGSHMVETQNHARFIFTTNESIPVSVDGNDRRYCLIECSNLHCKDGAFWDKFYEKLNKDKGMTLAFYQLLNTRDLSNVKWMQFPETELRKDMIATSAHPMVFWMDKFIRNEDFVLKDDNSYTAKTLHDHYNAYCVKKNMTPMSNSKAFGLIFKDKIDLDGCGIVKRKSHGVMVFDINKHKVFGWLQENELSNYEEVISGFVGVDEEDFL